MMATMMRRNVQLLLATIAIYMSLNIVVFIDCCHTLFYPVNTKTHTQCTYIVTVRHNHCCNGKAISITYYECVFAALVIQHAPYYTVIFGLPRSTTFFHVISQSARFLGEKVTGHNIFPLQLPSETFLILRRNKRNTTKNVQMSSRKVPVILARYYQNWNFLDRFRQKNSKTKFHENLSGGNPVVACGHADRHDTAKS